MRELDFSALSPQDALDLALLIEEEAQERYQEFADNLLLHHTPDAVHFYADMAGYEAKHRAAIQARREALFGDAPVRISQALLFDVEAPEFDQARIYMTAREAMEVALASEVKAYNFYDSALAHVTHAGVRSLFEDLRSDEMEHQDLIKGMLARLPPDDNRDDFDEDEPVAQ